MWESHEGLPILSTRVISRGGKIKIKIKQFKPDVWSHAPPRPSFVDACPMSEVVGEFLLTSRECLVGKYVHFYVRVSCVLLCSWAPGVEARGKVVVYFLRCVLLPSFHLARGGWGRDNEIPD